MAADRVRNPQTGRDTESDVGRDVIEDQWSQRDIADFRPDLNAGLGVGETADFFGGSGLLRNGDLNLGTLDWSTAAFNVALDIAEPGDAGYQIGVNALEVETTAIGVSSATINNEQRIPASPGQAFAFRVEVMQDVTGRAAVGFTAHFYDSSDVEISFENNAAVLGADWLTMNLSVITPPDTAYILLTVSFTCTTGTFASGDTAYIRQLTARFDSTVVGIWRSVRTLTGRYVRSDERGFRFYSGHENETAPGTVATLLHGIGAAVNSDRVATVMASPQLGPTLTQAQILAISENIAGDPAEVKVVADRVNLFGQTRMGVAMADVYRTTPQSIPNSTDTAVTFDSEIVDSDSMYNSAGAPTRITFNTAGVYWLSGHCAWAASAVGERGIYIKLNGTTILARMASSAPTVGNSTPLNVATIALLQVGDYIELYVTQFSGGALNTSNVLAPPPPRMSAVYLGSGA